MIKKYYSLTKPGLVYGNVLTAAAGFFLALPRIAQSFDGASQHREMPLLLFVAMSIGLSCIIASACTINNYLDRDMDARMERTKDRALVTGAISGKQAIPFALVLLALGIALLGIFTNWIALGFALAAFALYIFWYTPAKRTTAYATHIGALAGAAPPIVGYTALTHSLDLVVLKLFVIFFCWQMAHFYAIAIYRQNEYAAAHIPVWPITHGTPQTKWWIFLYILGFTIAARTLAAGNITNFFYVPVMLALGFIWLFISLYSFFTKNEKYAARLLFFYSLIVIVTWCVLLFFN